MVFLFLENGFEEIEAVTTLDVLRRAGVDVKSVGVSAKTLVGAHGIAVTADLTFEEYLAREKEATMLVVPGGSAVQSLCENEALKESFGRYTGGKLAAVCAAPLFLSRIGVTADKRVTAFPSPYVIENIKAREIVDAPVVIDGELVTGRSAGTAMEFAIGVVEVLLGAEKAAQVREGLVIR